MTTVGASGCDYCLHSLRSHFVEVFCDSNLITRNNINGVATSSYKGLSCKIKSQRQPYFEIFVNDSSEV